MTLKVISQSENPITKLIKSKQQAKHIRTRAGKPYYAGRGTQAEKEVIVYRGSSKTGEGVMQGNLGSGIYVTPHKGMAEAFANRHPDGIVKKYKLSPKIKLLGADTKEFIDIKKKYGLDYWESPPFKGISDAISEEVKKLGYEGIESRDVATGIVIFDKESLKQAEKEAKPISDLEKAKRGLGIGDEVELKDGGANWRIVERSFDGKRFTIKQGHTGRIERITIDDIAKQEVPFKDKMKRIGANVERQKDTKKTRHLRTSPKGVIFPAGKKPSQEKYWSKITKKYMPMEEIKPAYSLNREMNRNKIKAIKDKITKTGKIKPLFMDQRGLIDGHHRFAAMHELGVKDVPVYFYDGDMIYVPSKDRKEIARKYKINKDSMDIIIKRVEKAVKQRRHARVSKLGKPYEAGSAVKPERLPVPVKIKAVATSVARELMEGYDISEGKKVNELVEFMNDYHNVSRMPDHEVRKVLFDTARLANHIHRTDDLFYRTDTQPAQERFRKVESLIKDAQISRERKDAVIAIDSFIHATHQDFPDSMLPRAFDIADPMTAGEVVATYLDYLDKQKVAYNKSA